jgi:hypothetical protein
MSKISLAPDASGTGIFTISSPNSNTNRTLTLPDDTGTIVTNSGNQAGSFTTLNTSGAVVFNDAGADVDFRVEGDTDANLLFVDASADKVGIGTSSPAQKLDVSGQIRVSNGGDGFNINPNASDTRLVTSGTLPLTFRPNDTERMRIDSSGNLLVGQTAKTNVSNGIALTGAGNSYFTATSTYVALFNRLGTDGEIFFFQNDTTNVGSISVSGASTAYNTSSDYRLKENVAPMTGALAKVLELNPVTYTWKINGSVGEGFIAHELQAVCPDAVTGVKDETEIQQIEVSPAVPATYDEEGNELTPAVEAVYEEREAPKHQGVDTSFLVATLTAAIQELSAKNDALEARIAALETGV